MVKHPLNRLERLKIKNKKNEQKATIPKDKAGHVRHRLTVEALKAKEAEDEIRARTRLEQNDLDQP